jgi:glycosyltransferase involved in cell wall biosynthesis
MFPWLMSRGMLRAALAEDAWAYHSHDLVMALPALLAAARKRVLCVCDFHEWYSENVTYDEGTKSYRPHSWLKRLLFRAVESLALQMASRVVTVCDSIATELEAMQQPQAPVTVVRNIPPIATQAADATPPIDIRAKLAIPADKAILLYQGGVGPSRGLEPLIRAMPMVESAMLVIRGPFIEVFEEEYLRLAADVGAKGKVVCLPPVPSNRCVAEASVADIGFWTLLPLCKNFTYALPNKVFEYLAAGLPVVVAHHAEVAKLVDGYGVGKCFDPEDPASIAQAVEALAKDVALRRRCRANIAPALNALKADKEWAKLVALYQEFAKDDAVRETPRKLAA